MGLSPNFSKAGLQALAISGVMGHDGVDGFTERNFHLNNEKRSLKKPSNLVKAINS